MFAAGIVSLPFAIVQSPILPAVALTVPLKYAFPFGSITKFLAYNAPSAILKNVPEEEYLGVPVPAT